MIFFISIILLSRCFIIAKGDWDAGCGEPGYPSNGNRNVERNPRPKSMYFCNKGFYLVGSSIRNCNLNNSWTPAIPKCVKNLAINNNFGNLQSTCQLQIGQLYGPLYIDLGIANKLTDVHLEFKTDLPSNIFVFATNNSLNLLSSLTDRKTAVCAFHAVPSTSTFKCAHLKIKTRFLVLESSQIINVCEVTVLNTNEMVECGQPDQPLRGKIAYYNSTITVFECDRGFTMKGPKSAPCVNGAWEYASQCSQNIETGTQIVATFVEFPTQETVDEDGYIMGRNNFVVGIAVGITTVCILMLGLYFAKQYFFGRKSAGGRPIRRPSSISPISSPCKTYSQLYGSVGEGEYCYPQTHCPGNRPDVCPRRNEINCASTEADYLYPIQLGVDNLSSRLMNETYDNTSK